MSLSHDELEQVVKVLEGGLQTIRNEFEAEVQTLQRELDSVKKQLARRPPIEGVQMDFLRITKTPKVLFSLPKPPTIGAQLSDIIGRSLLAAPAVDTAKLLGPLQSQGLLADKFLKSYRKAMERQQQDVQEIIQKIRSQLPDIPTDRGDK